jgi:hypothetical protein
MILHSFPYKERPMFLSPEEWFAHYESCRADGVKGWEPATRDELMLAETSGLLALHPEWLPCVAGLRLLGLPEWFGKRQKPLSQLWQEKFVQTLIDNPNTVAAIRLILQGGPTNECN